MTEYETLADVYEWLMPDAKLTPDGSVAAFAEVVRSLPAHGRVLDCSCGSGQLAVGLAALGLDVVASDASAAMVRRTQSLAAEYGVSLLTLQSAWQGLLGLLEPGTFDLVMCVGNSLVHAQGASGRSAALATMSRLLRPGGRLVLTSRTWELVRAGGTRLDVRDKVIRRRGQEGVLIYSWQMQDDWDDEHHLEIAVLLIDGDGAVRTHSERLSIWPFRYEALVNHLHESGLTVESSSFAQDVDVYTVVARAGESPRGDQWDVTDADA